MGLLILPCICTPKLLLLLGRIFSYLVWREGGFSPHFLSWPALKIIERHFPYKLGGVHSPPCMPPASGSCPLHRHWRHHRHPHCHHHHHCLRYHHLSRIRTILLAAPPAPLPSSPDQFSYEFQLRHQVSDKGSSPCLHAPQHAPLTPHHVFGGEEGGGGHCCKAEGDRERLFWR